MSITCTTTGRYACSYVRSAGYVSYTQPNRVNSHSWPTVVMLDMNPCPPSPRWSRDTTCFDDRNWNNCYIDQTLVTIDDEDDTEFVTNLDYRVKCACSSPCPHARSSRGEKSLTDSDASSECYLSIVLHRTIIYELPKEAVSSRSTHSIDGKLLLGL